MLLWFAALMAWPAAAHMVSISTGEIQVEGASARYEFRVPLYEISHVKDPQQALLSAMMFRRAGQAAVRKSGSCKTVETESAFFCESTWEFPVPVERLEATSSFHKVTVPQHVHLLRATRDGVTNQVVLDLSIPKAEIRFVPPTLAERAAEQTLAGVLRAFGPAQLLFAVALLAAARSRRELVLLGGALLAGIAIACVAVPLANWQPAPRFVEAAAALTIAYLAVETLLLPNAGGRPLVVAVLGLFQGLGVAAFLAAATDYSAGWVLGGLALAVILLLAALEFARARIAPFVTGLRPERVVPGLLVIAGLGWFAVRLIQ